MRWSLRSPRSLQKFNFCKLIGGFTSPLYLNTGSGETGVQYPNDAAQGGWVGVTNHPAKLGDLLHRRAMRIECRVADVDCCGRAKGLVFHSENLPCKSTAACSGGLI